MKFLFARLNLGIHHDPSSMSFVSSLLKEGYINELVSEINALSRGIELFERDSEENHPGAVCVFETGFEKGADVQDVDEVNSF